jgi:acetolactate synthase I/II/III large subunit
MDAGGFQRMAADAIVEGLIAEGVPFVFGMTGDTILPVIDAIYRRQDRIRYVTTKFEMSTVAMADGYARVSNRLGVCSLHVGPSVSNAVLGAWTAQKDYVPLLVLSANLDRFRLGRNIWHEFDVVGVFSRIAKRSEMMLEPKDARRLLRTAVQVATSGLPGVAHLDFPKDLLAQPADADSFDLSLAGGSRMGFVSNTIRPAPAAVERALTVLVEARSPVIIAGRDVSWTEAETALVAFAEALGIPVVTTEMGRGSIPEDHPLSAGMMGHFGLTTPNTIVREADAVLGLGCQFLNVNTINWQLIRPDARIVQVEPDPLEIGRQYAVEVGVLASADAFLADALATARALNMTADDRGERAAARIAELKRAERERFYATDLDATPIKPQLIPQLVEKLAPETSIFACGAGHNTHFSNYIQIRRPRQYHYSIGSGSMAWAFPAALGMKLAKPDHTVFALLGDGDFGMSAQELETAVRERLPVVTVVYNDVSFGALRIFQKAQYGDRQLGSSYGETDWVALAKAYGAQGIRVDRPEELESALRRGIASDVATVIDVRIDPWELAHRTPEFKEFHRF